MTTTKGSWVTNRSVYQVVARHESGALTVAVVDPDRGTADPDDRVTLPAGICGGERRTGVRRDNSRRPGGHPVRFPSAHLGARLAQRRVRGVDPRSRVERGARRLRDRGRRQYVEPSVEHPVAVLARVVGREDRA